MQYTARYFREGLPSWKHKRDPIIVKFVYRPISFYTAAFCANRNITANSVSIFSAVIGIAGCILMAIPQLITGVLGGLLLNLWLLLDCTDGNLARSVRKQKYGEFFDAMSSYILIGLLFLSLGIRTFYLGSFLKTYREIYFLIGALTSICATLMSLLYLKYIIVSNDLGIEGRLYFDGSNSSKLMSIKTKVDLNMSVGGELPIVVLFANIIGITEVVLAIWCIYYFTEFIATALYFVYKACCANSIT